MRSTAVTRDHTHERVEALAKLAAAAGFDPRRYAGNRPLQLGTLGSGNHFIEVSLDEQDRVWLFLHSGSRGVGNRIAQQHIKVAQQQCAKWWIELPDRDLAYLVEGTEELDAYIRELRWAQRFAFENRAEMMDRLVGCVEEWLGSGVERPQEIDCHHDYIEQEHHFGKDVWLSRNGAIDAPEGRWG